MNRSHLLGTDSDRAIAEARRSAGIPGASVTRREHARVLLAQGWSPASVAAESGLCRRTVRELARTPPPSAPENTGATRRQAAAPRRRSRVAGGGASIGRPR